ncbi:TIGR03067 domain-containing protein [Telmatocola sphagniphila]|uniref:TIGR03067 domain-containing protein n=1 Tax=Telmatocola sphagniphila TaxID=1123043 RepID=A0A8E6B5Q8_9BACT|nr:TIGR03067 domain-containing protein [Telmatocola sphagniphila]QVL30890.1 TIGR03067 domain-containing protein [Telmatocola sphagniphila]
MKWMSSLLVILVLSVSAQADDWKTLEGVWIPVGMELGGQKFEVGQLKDSKLKLTKDKYELVFQAINDKGDIKLDSTMKPKQMDITSREGTVKENKDKTLLAIYEVNGDYLRVCYALEGTTRPTEFKTTKDNGFFLAEYKREKK